MTENHPITPPPELVQQWRRSGPADAAANNAYERHIATQAARWGADQELEACCEWLHSQRLIGGAVEQAFRRARRPKPPTLKEQALADLDSLVSDLNNLGMGFKVTNITRALKALPE